MRLITRTAYQYDELSTDAAREKAREAIYGMLSASGAITDILRQEAAEWLTNEGWTGLADLRFSDQADLEILQFSIGHVQGDFVVWKSTRPVGGWAFEGEVEVSTAMMHYGGGRMWMEVTTDAAEEYPDNDEADIQRRAEEMVNEHCAKVLRMLQETDIRLSQDEDYLSEYALNAEIEFWEDGSLATW